MRELDEALNLIKEKCVITRGKDGIADVTTTGLGANFNKTKLEKELGIRLFSFSFKTKDLFTRSVFSPCPLLPPLLNAFFLLPSE